MEGQGEQHLEEEEEDGGKERGRGGGGGEREEGKTTTFTSLIIQSNSRFTQKTRPKKEEKIPSRNSTAGSTNTQYQVTHEITWQVIFFRGC